MKYIVLVDIRNEIIALEEKGQLKSGFQEILKMNSENPKQILQSIKEDTAFLKLERLIYS